MHKILFGDTHTASCIKYIDISTDEVLITINNPTLVPKTGDMVDFGGVEYKILEIIWCFEEKPSEVTNITVILIRKDSY